jgi:hypothetical protein
VRRCALTGSPKIWEASTDMFRTLLNSKVWLSQIFLLFFSCPPPCQPGWLARGPCIHSLVAVFSIQYSRTFFVSDQTARPAFTYLFSFVDFKK